MLRINLLPSYVAQRRVRRVLVSGFTIAFVSVVAVMLVWAASLQPQLAKITQQASDAVAAKKKIDDLTAQATALQGQLPAIQAKVKFIQDLQDYNLSYAKLYRRVALWTSPRILYTSLNVSGTTLSISGYVPSLPDLARYMQIMYNEPDFDGISVDGIPALYSDYKPSSTTQPLNNLPPGYVARFPGSNLPVHSFTVVNGQITQIDDVGAGAAAAGAAQNTQGMPGMGGPGGPMQMGAFAGPAAVGAAVQAVATQKFNPRLGFDFKATAVLKKSVITSITPPTPPGGAGAAGNSNNGGPPGMMGGPGGMPGGPGMGGPGGPGGGGEAPGGKV